MGYETPTTLVDGAAPSEGSALSLVMVGPDGTRTRELPATARLTIGRAPENEIVVDDPAMSRFHAALIVGDDIALEDLGSANGTRLQGDSLPATVPKRLRVGEAFNLGSTIFVLRREAQAKPPTLRSHGYLEARLNEECAARQRGPKAPFALVRLRIEGEVATLDLERILKAQLRVGDVLASYAPQQLEVLLLDTSQTRARQIIETIQRELAKLGANAELGLALYPQSGTSADELIAVSGQALKPEAQRASSDIVVADPKIRALYDLVERVAQGTIAVLLLGETGVGKEVVAAAVHRLSPRSKQPFLRLNCAALSEGLVESELFGHEKGAFTGADQVKPGLMELASGGTLFLDEVGELPLATQAKLLRAIEQQEIMRVGGSRPRHIDVRLVSATNRDLPGDVAAGRFRGDLYYRINGVMLEIPPLRERLGEILPLAQKFLERASQALGRGAAPPLSPEALALLRDYAWPGNIRELKNTMERAVLLTRGPAIEAVDLPFEKLSTKWPVAHQPAFDLEQDDDALKARIVEALERVGGNQTRAAQSLGISRTTLAKLLTRFGFARPKKSAR